MRDSSHIIDGLPPTDRIVRQILDKLHKDTEAQPDR
jgi:hypothetical protein